ncbi:UDP-N-acetylmuramoyl-L-alanyl-D-glutamate--2,6-diaminopimelate ligase [Caldisericum exile]|uniref:UDP-N-acetylmuramyl-tripeptide synthetase n=1 Tax=Caldisericum exile (strain DSM 21853 / NBRC 104410 / AZM16c01) TaxID=511051 RepID=A0A7U6GFD6_CALEA|nr:UDP-N-acetylmuramoyl-L-alanyl-D-glutamate--2,6-diaminopimelate ligase [Caldisericum exile]BAL81312.1 UDP-N-acetylmuramoyl-L-alanyl-D-glutamate--2,6-diaminopimelate ligase [Caldisericum exile AZM16c01]
MNGRILKEKFKDFEIYGNLERVFFGIKTDSRVIENGDLFVALKGENFDGHDFVFDAVKRGAVGVIIEKDLEINEDILVIKTHNSREAFAKISSFFFGDPSDRLTLIGVTGTMGKTTITYLLYRLFNYLGVPSGFIGTIGIGIKDNFSLVDLEPPTTPFPFDLHRYLKTMLDDGVKYVFMEVSSHGIKDKRIYGINFKRKILGTMGTDHIEYHKSLEDYIKTKVSFFDGFTSPILNGNSLYIDRFIEVSKDPIFYGGDEIFDYSFQNLKTHGTSIYFDVYQKGTALGAIDLPILGRYNAYNFLAVLSCAMLEGANFSDIKDFAKNALVPGRMEIYTFKGIKVVIDYAHNPDEIESVLESIKNIGNRLIVVFGAVGTSEKEKRVSMGASVSKFADFCVVTSDDPRGHDIESIIKDVASSVSIKHKVIPDRIEAIKYALNEAKENDVIAILGRGVESKMHMPNGEILRFRDIDIVKEVFHED